MTLDGREVGTHDGLMYYTIGQRRGLGIGGRSDSNGERWFVLEKNLEKNQLVVSQGEDDALFSKALIAEKFNFIPEVPQEKTFSAFAKFRYRQPDQEVVVHILENGKVKIEFLSKQRAITKGQYAVLYDENGICLGGGEIEKVFD